MAYKIRLIGDTHCGWVVEVWDAGGTRIYAGKDPNRTLESARGEGKLFLYHRDQAAEYDFVEARVLTGSAPSPP